MGRVVSGRLEAFLASLGATADEVAETLRRKGVRGLPCVPGACPVARAIERDLGSPGRCGVSLAWTDDHEDSVAMPEPVAEFVKAFDRGRYADLQDVR